MNAGGNLSIHSIRPLAAARGVEAHRRARRILAAFFLAALIALASAPAAPAAPSDLDATFGSGGKVRSDFGPSANRVNAVAIQQDGKIVTAGNIAGLGGDDILLTRFNPDGSPDASFGVAGRVITMIGAGSDEAHAIALQADGKIVVAGDTYAGLATDGDVAILRYNPDGSPDGSFGAGGVTTIPIGAWPDSAHDVAIQPDGKIVAAGYHSSAGDYQIAVVRVGETGSPDNSFDGDGIRTLNVSAGSDSLESLLIEPGGSILAAGASDISGSSGILVLRLTATGGLDPSMNGTGTFVTQLGDTSSQAKTVLRQPDGRIVVAARAVVNGQMFEFALTRLEANGDLDAGFGGGGLVRTTLSPQPDFLNDAELQPDGKILVAGTYDTGTGTSIAVMRFNPNGTPDTGFSLGGLVTTAFDGTVPIDSQANAMALQPDAKIVVAGNVLDGLDSDQALVRFMGDWVAPVPAVPTPAATITSPAKRTVARKKLKRFSGTAGSAGSVAKVEIALRKVDKRALKRKRCRWLKNSRSQFKTTRSRGKKCTPPRFLKASGKDSWKYRLKRSLAKGSYELYVRVTLADGTRHTTFTAAQGNFKKFRAT